MAQGLASPPEIFRDLQSRVRSKLEKNHSDIPDSERACKDIAYQLVKENPRIQVILGGGRRNFLPQNSTEPNRSEARRTDGLNLVEEWKQEKMSHGFTHSYVYDKEGFDRVNPTNTDYLLGLFTRSHMEYEAEHDNTKEPSMAEMTSKAIQILSKNPNGFYLGRIDHANHANKAHKTFADVEAMNQAVHNAQRLTSDRETQIVVTADHTHVLALAGYASRGHNILGLSTVDGELNTYRASDDKPYTTVIFGNGPGWSSDPRPNLTEVDTSKECFNSVHLRCFGCRCYCFFHQNKYAHLLNHE
ncbi:alkaline phosphatase [Plakobranchus ocellatus]|uniref:alkaline phosphatase n=1 Tax=Plakobranchus ocellatus TaxID=259542 RepID=A0AAV4B718_9GAST|nr:alkaline phosphatase [Plakobranchus ocellatus]